MSLRNRLAGFSSKSPHISGLTTCLAVKITAIFAVLQFFVLPLCAQSIERQIDLGFRNKTLHEALGIIAKESGFAINYTMEQVENHTDITLEKAKRSVGEILDMILANTGLTYKLHNRNILIVNKEASGQSLDSFTVQGTVSDADNNRMEGVNVYLKGEQKGTITDSDGRYSIEISPGSSLVYSFLGYETVEIIAGSQTQQDIIMYESLTDIGEVVIINTGYQNLKREKMTGATVSVSGEELGSRYYPDFLNNLEGRVAGLVRYQDKTTIRGTSSLHATTTPLAVVDGLPFEGDLSSLNPYDIENITVLKDAAATAIYGARASNGIIVVTTKQAKEKGKTAIDISGNITVYQKPDYGNYNYMTPAQQVDVESNYYDYYFNGGVIANPVQTVADYIDKGNSITPVQYLYYMSAQGLVTQADFANQLNDFKKNDFAKQFRDHALENRILQQYNIAVRNKSDKFQSNLVLNFKTDNSGIIHDRDNRFNVFYKGTYDVNDWMSVNFGSNIILENTNSSNSNFASSPFNVSPYLRLLDDNGNRMYYTTSVYNMYNPLTENTPALQNMTVNHLDELKLDRTRTSGNNMRYYANMNIKIIRGLTFNPQFQYESSRTNISSYSEEESFMMRYLKNIYTLREGVSPNYAYTYLLPENGGKLASTNTSGNSWTARGQVNFNRAFGKHAFDVIAGVEFRQTQVKGIRNLLLGYDEQLQSHATTSVSYPALNALTSTTFFKPGFNPVNTYNTYLTNSVGVVPETVHRFNSAYANATYTYDGRYNAFASYRKDYADMFGLDKKFRGKPLWSAGLGWNIHREDFLKDIKWVDFAKLRVSYGVTGNIYLGATSFLTANSSLFNAATKLPVSVVESAANPELRWEKNTTVNIGIDFNLFGDRLGGSVDWYRKKGSDIFSTTRIDPSEGFTSQIINNGDLLNKGLEVSLRYNWFGDKTHSGFQWSTLAIVSHNKNKIVYVDEVSITPLALAQGGFKVGYPVNSLFSLQYKGLDETGKPQWLKADNTLTTVALAGTDMDAVIYSGESDPEINIGITNDFRYKGFSLNVLLVYYGGHYLRALQPAVYQAPSYGPLPSYVLDSWTPDHVNTVIPGFGQYAPVSVPSSHLEYSDAFVRPGAFVKIRNIVLGYEIPPALTKKIGLKQVNVNIQLNNPKALWLKNKVNIDPETGSPQSPAFYVFGININL
ncbi:MAG: SusC/RagA family TonB-linked outer membrane protein [Prevotellaceae bacterium]|nr:SusC/RagA family TonB-linked outer membrane protein [Prevotellaceae bacterium]